MIFVIDVGIPTYAAIPATYHSYYMEMNKYFLCTSYPVICRKYTFSLHVKRIINVYMIVY